MRKISSLKPPPKEARLAQSLSLPGLAAIICAGLFLVCPFRAALYFAVFIGCFCLRNPIAIALIVHWRDRVIACHPWLKRVATFQTIGILAGTLLFLSITLTSSPALAQILNQAEQEVTTIFGTYLQGDIIPFLFGVIRVLIWVAAVGFVFFAIAQAQRGEQWQPLAQNAFIVVAVVVLVEGLSTLFFGGGTGGSTGNGGNAGGGGAGNGG
jgi:uncharacterized membrane protein HdeD (DUF308 family)